MKKILVFVLSLMFFVSCNRNCDEECYAFDFNSEISQWLLFSRSNDVYNFKSASTEDVISFKKQSYSFDEFPDTIEQSCDGGIFYSTLETCSSPYLRTTFVSDSISIGNDMYQQNTGTSNFDERFSISVRGSKLKDTASIYSALNKEDFLKDSAAFIDSLVINEKIYNNIRLFNFERGIETIYVSKGIGAIRIIVKDEIYNLVE